MEHQVINLSRHLLNSGAFNHLSDAELSRIQWMVYNKRLADGTAERLMHYWYYADFFAAGVPQFLLHECNLVLQQYGLRTLDMLMAAELDY